MIASILAPFATASVNSAEEVKKLVELTDEQMDMISGGGAVTVINPSGGINFVTNGNAFNQTFVQSNFGSGDTRIETPNGVKLVFHEAVAAHGTTIFK